MSFHEIRFPDNISYGSRGGPGFSTSIVTTDSGQEYRIPRWGNAKRRYNAAYGVKSHEDLADLIKFYIARLGPAYGFRFKDFIDCTSSDPGYATELGGTDPDFIDQEIGTGDNSTIQFQLVKRYVSGVITRYRNITKPVADTVRIGLDGVEATTGWSVNTTTGIVTFTAPPALDVRITAGYEFDVPVRFGNETDEAFQASIEDYGSGSLGDIPLVEIRDTNPVDGEFLYGGATSIALTATYTLSPLEGRVISLVAAGNLLHVELPDPTDLPAGGPYFYLYNYSASPYLINIDDEGGNLLHQLAQADTVTVVLTAEKDWLVL